VSTAAKRRAYGGRAFLSAGFRLFFLFACIWPALSIPFWVLAWLGVAPFAGALSRDWHVHEMLFGYLSGVMAGFLLTAIPNWTGRLPVMGAPLAGLAALWAAGRAAMLLAPTAIWAASVDAAFLVVFAGVVWREVLAGRNWRNAPVCLLVTLMALANIGAHLRPVSYDLAQMAERLAMAVATMLIALIGGRVTPSFTRNWLMQRRDARLPAASSRFDVVVLALTGLAVLAWTVLPQQPLTGVALALAGIGNLARLARWRGARTLAEPLVWVLHAGYGWVGLALALLGGAALAPSAIPMSAGVHALTAGAIGVMTLAMMTRATLGHTGRSREAGPGTLVIYLCANAAACLRIAAAFLPAGQAWLLGVSGCAWTIAFAGFVVIYGPLLMGLRAGRAVGSPATGAAP
jgi:uncharacterized protein involved in response to NO